MKKISEKENRKAWIVLAVVLLLVVAMITGISVKSCSQKSGKSNGSIETEQGKSNTGKDEDNGVPGLTVADPKDEKTENIIDASGSWDEPSEPGSPKNEDDKNDNSNSTTEDDILKDDKTWGNIY